MLAGHFGLSGGARSVAVHDAFVVRYEEGKQRHLPLHRDQSTHSFTASIRERAGLVPRASHAVAWLALDCVKSTRQAHTLATMMACFRLICNSCDLATATTTATSPSFIATGGRGGGEGSITPYFITRTEYGVCIERRINKQICGGRFGAFYSPLLKLSTFRRAV